MARFKNGILGGFSGKLGTVVGYTLGDVEVLRALPRKKSKSTKEEKNNQLVFGLIQDTLSTISPLVRNGFNGFYTKTGGIRGAISYNRRFALTGTAPDIQIDPGLFMFSGGDLPGASNPTFEQEDTQIMRFTWDTEVSEGAHALDQVMLLVMDFAGKTASYCNIGAFRKSGTEAVHLTQELLGKEVHLYIGFVAKDRSRQSQSQYLGSTILSAE